MKYKKRVLLDFAAALLGVFEVDWENDFADDGYTDFPGRENIAEPVFYDEFIAERAPANTINLAKPRADRAQ